MFVTTGSALTTGDTAGDDIPRVVDAGGVMGFGLTGAAIAAATFFCAGAILPIPGETACTRYRVGEACSSQPLLEELRGHFGRNTYEYLQHRQ